MIEPLSVKFIFVPLNRTPIPSTVLEKSIWEFAPNVTSELYVVDVPSLFKATTPKADFPFPAYFIVALAACVILNPSSWDVGVSLFKPNIPIPLSPIMISLLLVISVLWAPNNPIPLSPVTVILSLFIIFPASTATPANPAMFVKVIGAFTVTVTLFILVGSEFFWAIAYFVPSAMALPLFVIGFTTFTLADIISFLK